MIKVISRVEIAEITPSADDDSSYLDWDSIVMEVRSYGESRDGLVQILVDGKRFAVSSKDLLAAVQNASNIGEP